jgi:hypothetical protein
MERNNVWRLLRFGEKHYLRDPEISMNPKYSKHKENHTQTQSLLNPKNQGELESSKRKFITYKRQYYWLIFLHKQWRLGDIIMIYSKC